MIVITIGWVIIVNQYKMIEFIDDLHLKFSLYVQYNTYL